MSDRFKRVAESIFSMDYPSRTPDDTSRKVRDAASKLRDEFGGDAAEIERLKGLLSEWEDVARGILDNIPKDGFYGDPTTHEDAEYDMTKLREKADLRPKGNDDAN